MPSPDKISFSSFISLDRKANTSLYLQAVQQLVNAIQRGFLPANTKLPGTRALATDLNINRQTAVAVYAELEAQGWIKIEANKGAYVIALQKRDAVPHPYKKLVALASYPQTTGFKFASSNLLDTPPNQVAATYTLNDGQPDYSLTPIKELAAFYSATIKRKGALAKIQSGDTTYFKTQIANYLNQSRGLHIGHNNVLTTKNTQINLYIIARTLLAKGDVVAVANLSYFGANMAFQQAGATLKTIPTDQDGIIVSALEELLQHTKIRMLYVMPHHHYPTTVTLSAQRRVEILQLAKTYNFIIVEDDYDDEFQYHRRRTLPMASADTNGMVVYLGSLGKSLLPAFNIGFIVAPQNLIAELQKYKALIDSPDDNIMAQVLANMIEDGHMHRHLKKVNKIYQQRCQNACQQIDKYLGNAVTFAAPQGGLAIWLTCGEKIPLVKFAQLCLKNGLLIPQQLLYQDKNTTAIRFGFAHLNSEALENILQIMQASLLEVHNTISY